jgi:two-component system, OmpR family, sensor histidine kinase PhoQ
MHSISRRLLVLLTLLMLLSFGAMIAVLDARFRTLAERSLRDLLDAQIVALIASAESDDSGHVVPRLQETEGRLLVTGSGLYAAVMDGQETYWRSPSATGSVTDFGPAVQPGGRAFRYLTDARGERLAAVSRGFQWEDAGSLTFVVASELTSYNAQLSRFRNGLAGGFVAVALLLLAALAVLLRWALAPLRRLAREIRAVERGEREQLDDRWPEELHGVVVNLNTLLDAERRRIARYRDTLGNLAHSLKTPLSVLRAIFAPGTAGAAQVDEQVERMNAIVEHQLRRAATSGGASVGQQALQVLPVAQELRRTLLKAHARKDFGIEVAIPEQLLFVGDRDDLTEALGNLLDNAAKWCRSRVRVTGQFRGEAGVAQRLQLVVEDDGPGIAPTARESVLQRGARADEHTPGHGLGLAMVRDMAGLYGGQLTLGESEWGGCRVELRLPGRVPGKAG